MSVEKKSSGELQGIRGREVPMLLRAEGHSQQHDDQFCLRNSYANSPPNWRRVVDSRLN